MPSTRLLLSHRSCHRSSKARTKSARARSGDLLPHTTETTTTLNLHLKHLSSAISGQHCRRGRRWIDSGIWRRLSGLVRFVPTRPGSGRYPRGLAGIRLAGVKSRRSSTTCSVNHPWNFTPPYFPRIPLISQGNRYTTLIPWKKSPNRYD
jgi:hypothetical protein